MTKLDKMWAALKEFLTDAYDGGHGDSWAEMCRLKTAESAVCAAADAHAEGAEEITATGPIGAAYAAANAINAALSGHVLYADYYAQQAIDCINEA